MVPCGLLLLTRFLGTVDATPLKTASDAALVRGLPLLSSLPRFAASTLSTLPNFATHPEIDCANETRYPASATIELQRRKFSLESEITPNGTQPTTRVLLSVLGTFVLVVSAALGVD